MGNCYSMIFFQLNDIITGRLFHISQDIAILLPYIPTLCRITYFYIMDTSMGWNMDLRPAQELVTLLRRDHFIFSLAVCKPMTSYHVVVH